MASEKIFDSNVWVGFFHKNDTLNARAHALIDAHHGVFVMPDFIFAETATVLKRTAGFTFAEKFITLTLQNVDVHILGTGLNFTSFVAAFLGSRKNKLSFTDTSLLSLAREYEIVSFDKELVREVKRVKKI